MNQGLPHGFWRQRTPWSWSPATVEPWTQTRPLEVAQITDINMDPGGSSGHSDQHGLKQKHGPWTSIWLQGKAQTMDIQTAIDITQTPAAVGSQTWSSG